jgi:formylglycine-generating enzyme required for sulfatase activity
MSRFKTDGLNRTGKSVLALGCLALFVFFSGNVYPAKESGAKKKVYISTIKAKNEQLAKKVKDGIRLAIFESFGAQYQVLDDDAIKVMYKQAEQILSSGCTDESCMTQIAEGINADEIIYGDLMPDGGRLTISVTCLERKGTQLGSKSIVKVSFFESQLDHFASEAGKKLIDPKYIIKKDIAESFEGKISLKGIAVERIKDIGVKDVSGFSIEVLKFNTTDDAIQNILASLKNVVKKGDDEFQAGKYESAVEEYNTALGRIQQRLRPESREKLQDFTGEIKKRIDTSYQMDFKRDIEKGDADFQKGEYKSARKKYNTVFERINGLPAEVKRNMDEILAETKTRVESTYVMIYKKDVEEIDAKFKGKDSADEFFLTGIIKKYKDIENDFTEVPKEIYGEGMSSLQNAINDRKDSAMTAIAALYEKNGDKAYGDYKFVEANEYYSMGNEKSRNIFDQKKKDEATARFDKKIATTFKTGQGYIENRVKSLADQAEFYNVDEKTSQAKSVIRDARKLVIGPMRIFVTPPAIETFNKIAGVLELGRISTESDPELYAAIDKIKAEEKRIAEEKERMEWEKRAKAEREARLAELKKKGLVAKKIGGIMFMRIPGGSFMMGSPAGEGYGNEHPQHRVTFNSFFIGMYEVTQKQYRDLMGENPSYFKGDDLPVEQVSYNDAMKFCKRFSAKYGVKARLPYETEWEYACRAGSATTYYWGNNVNDAYCWYEKNSGRTTNPVGQKLPNALGLYDMSGNVWEWCMDWYGDDYYQSSPAGNPLGPRAGSSRVRRGGSWDNRDGDLRSAFRSWDLPDDRSSNDGFRVVLSIP